MRKSLAGTRIREARRKSGMTQKALAGAAGISASYLNLIEHNRRAVAGKVLLAIARALKLPVAALTDAVESALLGDLFEAAAHRGESTAETDRVDEMISRFPGWAGLLAGLYRQSRDQEAAIAALSDRLTHDPFLAESLHSMLSNITAIRSTSNILKTIDDIEPDQQSRFHNIIHEESRRLSDAAQALVTYFDHASEQSGSSATPEEELDRFLQYHNYVFPELDRGGAEDITTPETMLQNPESRALAKGYLGQYTKDAAQMPLAEFWRAAQDCGFHPSVLAQKFNTDLASIFRRLSHLKRAGIDAPDMGLIVVNAAGRAVLRRPLHDFALPRHGNACPRWPLFQAFAQPGRPITALLDLPGGQQFICLAIARDISGQDFGKLPEYQASMLFISTGHMDLIKNWLPATGPAQEIGISCRICPRADCSVRAEPQILATTPEIL
ncbi:MAG: short-chain fatty acyl-CoA regulator family protein [Rhodobacteraceae bacterium]|nr:short-chain fatty acyl-CoA regulator family protein [Paracoccaceae bacterium]